jgi:hypothetical protein
VIDLVLGEKVIWDAVTLSNLRDHLEMNPANKRHFETFLELEMRNFKNYIKIKHA